MTIRDIENQTVHECVTVLVQNEKNLTYIYFDVFDVDPFDVDALGVDALGLNDLFL